MSGRKLTADAWVDTLRTYVGTPFHHQGRAKGAGIDCVGLLIAASLDLGIDHGASKVRGYAHTPDSRDFFKFCKEFLDILPYNRLQDYEQQIEVGDVISFWIDKPNRPRHVAVYTGNGSMIHSFAKQERGVIECKLDRGFWEHRIDNLWRVPELSEGVI